MLKDGLIELDFLLDRDGDLIIRVYQLEAAKEETEIEGVPIKGKELLVSENLPQIEVYFDEYISYHVDNESYATYTPNYEGNTFRIYTESALLDYIDKNTIAFPLLETDVTLKKSNVKHYKLVTVNSIISIVTTREPTIKKIPI